ncbi:MAG TPA: hypothetical protein VGI45_12900 [Terracidiphilus sp.]|jgi:hypothetical protein
MFEKLRTVFSNQKKKDVDEDWPSIVMLLRDPQLPTAEEAVDMARGAWGAAGPVELVGTVGPHNFAIRVSPLTFALHAVADRYSVCGPPLPLAQQKPWDEHRAWFAVDLPGRRCAGLRETGQLGAAYQSLLHFVARHWSANCLAVYFPGERVSVPNQGDLIQSIRWARQNGTNLDFLKVSKAQ